MFGDLMGNFNKQSEEMHEVLSKIQVTADANDHAIDVHGNATGIIENVQIDAHKLNLQDTEELEDLILIACNRFNAVVKEIQEKQSKEMIQNLLPPGMDNLFG